MRDILAALLRDRGYTHDENDSDDYWYGPTLGVRPLMVCVQWELDRDAERRRRERLSGVLRQRDCICTTPPSSLENRCSTCGAEYDAPPCSRNPETGAAFHTVSGGVGASPHWVGSDG